MTEPTTSISRRLLGIAVPLMGVNLLSMLGYVVDNLLCGQLSNSTVVLGGLGFADQILAIMTYLMFGVTVGTVALISRAHGAKDTDRVNHILTQSTTLTVIVGAAVAVLLLIFERPLLILLGAKPDMLEPAVDYLEPMIISTPIQFLILLYNGVLRGVGNTRLAFAAAFPAQIVNIVITWILVLGPLGTPSIGVRGAAIGSVIGFLVNLVLLIAPLAKGKIPNVRLPLRLPKLDKPIAKEILRIGLPAGIEMAMNLGAFMILVGFLARIDPLTMAAHGVSVRIQRLTLLVGGGISQATAALVGMALGRSSIEDAKRTVKVSSALSVGMMGSIALVLVLAADPIARLFGIEPDTKLHDYTMQCLRLMGLWQLLSAIHLPLLGLQHGSGGTKTTMTISIASIALQLPAAVLLAYPLDLGAFGIWLSLSIGMGVKVVLDIVVYRGGGWEVRGIQAKAKPKA